MDNGVILKGPILYHTTMVNAENCHSKTNLTVPYIYDANCATLKGHEIDKADLASQCCRLCLK